MTDAFEQEALPYRNELFAAAMRYARHRGDAEDLVQETLLRAYSAWDHFRSGTNCRAWLLRILVNNYINLYRKNVKERRLDQIPDPMICPQRARAARDPEGTLFDQLLGDEVTTAMAALPKEYREVVLLADVRGLSYREVADELGCPLGTVMSRLHRARRQLQTILAPYARERGIIPKAA